MGGAHAGSRRRGIGPIRGGGVPQRSVRVEERHPRPGASGTVRVMTGCGSSGASGRDQSDADQKVVCGTVSGTMARDGYGVLARAKVIRAVPMTAS